MKLLITTQAVDATDPILGFFHRWIEECARHCEQVEVVCLREGEHAFPPNVRVHQLGKGRLRRAADLLRLSFSLRSRYDAVLVHMNPEYVLVAEWLWRLLGKKTGMWYAHGGIDGKLRLATRLTQRILTSSPEGFRVATGKVRVVGQGIDTAFFTPGDGPRGKEILSVGRLSRTKRHDLVIAAAAFTPREIWIAGDGPERQTLETAAQTLQVASRVHFLGSRTQAQVRELYRKAGIFAHFSKTGSMDKVVLEALCCGMPVVSSSEAFRTLLEPHGCFLDAPEPKTIAAAVERVATQDIGALVQEVRVRHSLDGLIPRILEAYK